MSGLRHCLLCFCILGYIFCSSRAWRVKMPSHIKGLLGSCLVIPCKFDYHRYPPVRPDRVVWYQYADHGYPLVYDKWNPGDVIYTYKGRTRGFTSAYSKTCSLKIEPVKWFDHSQKLYPWVDPENVGRGTYRFWDTTVTIEVVGTAEAPDLNIYGILRVGQTVTVQCSIYHTCSTNPPTLSFNIPLQNPQLRHTEHEYTTKTTLTTHFSIESDYQIVTCSVRHPGGLTARASKILTAQCSISPLTIRSTSNEFLEGYASKVMCTATYTCSKHKPTITWNYGGTTVTHTTKVSGAALWRTESMLTFTSSASSDGGSLACIARYPGGQIQRISLTLRVKRNMENMGWSFTTPGSVTGMRGSCIIIPCRFTYSTSQPSDLQVIWYLYQSSGYPAVYNQRGNDVISEFRGKTSLMGSVSDKNCSLKIEKLEMSHNHDRLYPWIDKNSITSYQTTGHSFYDKTTQLIVTDGAQEPQLSMIGIPRVGEQSRVSCSVRHTCLSAPPTLTLSGVPGTEQPVDTLVSDGMWERTVTRSWTVEEEHQSVKCSVSYPGGQKASRELQLNVECPHEEIKMVEPPGDATEGVAKSVICAVSYKCKRNTPTIVWNYEDMQSSLKTKKVSSSTYQTVSNLTFIGALEDDGKSMTCTAQFRTGETSDSATLRIKRNMLSRDWSFTTPGSLTGMRGSCIIIPCRFTYSTSQPSDLQVIWYLYQSSGYPAVYNQRGNDVISEFRGKTSLMGSVSDKNCSLKIEKLEMSHNDDRLYPWIDKNPITSYQTTGHSFYDKTTQLIVTDGAQEPQLSMIGIPRVGEQSRVSCSVRHTCLSAPPTLTLSGVPGTEQTVDTLVSDGMWERTVTRSWTVEEEHQSVKCSVSYPGGQKASSELQLNVECPYEDIMMTEPPGETIEGVAKSVICAVSYKCKKNKPTIVWNYEDMQSSLKTKEISRNTYNIASNLTFIGTLDDDGKSLTCTAHFRTGETSDSATLHIKKYVRPVEDLHKNDTLHVLAADVPFRFSALTRSCVVIPCSFQYEEDIPLTRGIWSKKTGGIVFHNGQTHVTDHFKGRTKLLGDLNEGNCSLEIDDIKPFDNGPFCFHAEKGHDKYRFNNSCVFIVMKASPEKPVMTKVPAEVDAGSTITVSCSVAHTCPSHPPVFSWSVPHLSSEISHTTTSRGIWETKSTISFMVAAGDGVTSLTCTATFWQDKQQAGTVKLNVKGSLMYQLRSSLPVSVPVSLLVLIIIISAAVFGVFMCKKRKHTDDGLTPPPRPEKRRSLWDRLSRRFPEERERPPRPEKRKSMWSRFTRREQDERVGWQNERLPRKSFWSRFSRRQGNTANISVGYLNNTNAVICDPHVDKPRFPSPKDHRRRPHP